MKRGCIRCLYVLFALFVFALTSACKDETKDGAGAGADATEHMTELEGSYTGIAMGDDDALFKAELIVADTNVMFSVSSNGTRLETYEGYVASVRTNTVPREVDVYVTNAVIGKDVVSNFMFVRLLAIYRLDDGFLTLSANEPGNPERPISFDDGIRAKLTNTFTPPPDAEKELVDETGATNNGDASDKETDAVMTNGATNAVSTEDGADAAGEDNVPTLLKEKATNK